jgi:sporulation protein YlmC with PRC-barrel domain
MENLILSSTALVGTDVKNRFGENLGTVKDVVIDMQAGRVAYLVLAFGGIFGIGDKYFAMPFEAFKVDSVDEKLILNIDKDQLLNAPEFNKEHISTPPEREFIEEMYRYYGYNSYYKSRPETIESHSTDLLDDKEEELDWNPDRNLDETTFRSNFLDIPDSGTRNRNLDPDRSKNNF